MNAKYLAWLTKTLAEHGARQGKRIYLTSAVASEEPRADGKKLIQLFPLGKVTTVDGEEWSFSQENLSGVAGALNAAGQEIPVYPRHWEPEYSDQDPVGWISEFHVTAAGLFGWVRWIDAAIADRIRQEKVKYTSPGFFGNDAGDLESVYEVTLTNVPRMQGMRQVEASIKTTSPRTASTEKGKPRMKQLRAILKLADDASEEDVEKAVMAALDEARNKASEQARTADGRFASLDAKIAALDTEIQATKKERDEGRRIEQTATIEHYVRDNQLTKAEADALDFPSACKLAALRTPGAMAPTKQWFKGNKAAAAPKKEDLDFEEAKQMALEKGKPLGAFLLEYYQEAN